MSSSGFTFTFIVGLIVRLRVSFSVNLVPAKAGSSAMLLVVQTKLTFQFCVALLGRERRARKERGEGGHGSLCNR